MYGEHLKFISVPRKEQGCAKQREPILLEHVRHRKIQWRLTLGISIILVASARSSFHMISVGKNPTNQSYKYNPE